MMTAPLPDIAAPAAPPRRLPFSFAKRQGLLFLCLEEQYWLACRPQVELAAIAEAQRFAGRRLPLKALGEDAFNQALAASYQHDSSAAMQLAEDLGGSLDLAALADQVPETEDLMEQEDDAPIIRLINAILGEAIRENASDIHLETFENAWWCASASTACCARCWSPSASWRPCWYRGSRSWRGWTSPRSVFPRMADFPCGSAGREVDIRGLDPALGPTANGWCWRLLDKQAGRTEPATPGHERARPQADGRKRCASRTGILLVTGPTGSGKTTTLYASLTTLNDRTRNILTVEDPIEYHLEGIGQTQVNAKVDMTFARGLRAILRQDPDVGDGRRDPATGRPPEIAVQASLDRPPGALDPAHQPAPSARFTRLVDMGIEPFLLSSSMLGVLAQRLVRVLCPACKEPYRADEAECALLGVDPARAADPASRPRLRRVPPAWLSRAYRYL
ncbi:general secretion pathway protein E [Pseudomonas aeruginosa]|nr:general secretion pathway protein E [Pseudomonas aeruginosa]